MATANLAAAGQELGTDRRHKIADWYSRIVMLPPMLVYVLVGGRIFIHTAHAIPGVVLTTPEAFTDTRVMSAWFFTGLVMQTTFLARKSRLWLGNMQVALFMGFVLIVRIYGFAHDGTTLAMGDQRQITIAETVFLTLNAVGLWLQMRNGRRNIRESS